MYSEFVPSDERDRILARYQRAYKQVWRFVRAWEWLARRLRREPSIEEFAHWWAISGESAREELDLFHECFPEETSPARVAWVVSSDVDRSAHEVCVRCGALVPFVGDVSIEDRLQVMRFWLDKDPGGALSYLRERVGMSPGDSKSLLIHPARRGGRCNQCGGLLDEDERTHCRNCRFLERELGLGGAERRRTDVNSSWPPYQGRWDASAP